MDQYISRPLCRAQRSIFIQELSQIPQSSTGTINLVSDPSASRFPNLFSWAIALLLVASIARGWLMPLHNGYWLDETGTYYLISGTWDQFLQRMSHTIQSPIYCTFLWVVFHTIGPHELILRLPSVVAMALAAYWLYRFASEAIHPDVGKLALVTFVAMPDVAQLSFQARPYSLLIAAVAAAAFYFHRWLNSGARSAGYACVLAMAVAFYGHVAGGLIGAVFLAVIIRLFVFEGKRFHWIHISVGLSLFMLLIVPVFPYYLAAAREAATYSFSGSPSSLALISASPAVEPLASLLVGLCTLVLFVSRLTWRPLPVTNATVAFIALWLFLPPFVLLVISKVTPAKLFVPRYYSLVTPAAAILIGLLVSLLKNQWHRLALITIIVLTLTVRSWSIGVWPKVWGIDWRMTSHQLLAQSYAPQTPVFLRTGFVEAKSMTRLEKKEYREFILSPISLYPFPGTVRALPDSPDSQFDAYMATLTNDLARQNMFVVVADDHWVEWFRKRFLGSFQERTLPTVQRISIVEFRRTTPADLPPIPSRPKP
ncbi:MAG: glycosyltransferase family 39 protein [Acidobacteria bacterium]|nr:glycosyltransferase family 39 protein [Acidobacteriota bacterium]